VTSGNAIEITTDNVVINLNGHRLDGLAAGLSTNAMGIYAFQRKNITIKNGTIRGFAYGIVLDDIVAPYTASQGHIIENIRADMNTTLGIGVLGQGSLIRNNMVVKTGDPANEIDVIIGIGVKGPGVRVLNNDIIETREKTNHSAYAICILEAPGAVVENNRIGNASLGDGTSVGIYIFKSDKVLVINNRLTTMNYGIWYLFGSSSGKFRDNLTYDAPFPGVHSGTDAGNNN
jgi:nitrous oxidase accessory protein NosD